MIIDKCKNIFIVMKNFYTEKVKNFECNYCKVMKTKWRGAAQEKKIAKMKFEWWKIILKSEIRNEMKWKNFNNSKAFSPVFM